MHCGLAVIYASCDTQWMARCLLLSPLRTRLAILPSRNDDESPADQQIIAVAFSLSPCWYLCRLFIPQVTDKNTELPIAFVFRNIIESLTFRLVFVIFHGQVIIKSKK